MNSLLQHHFEQLSQVLSCHQALWQFAPFEYAKVPWAEQYPDLAASLADLSEHHICQMLNDSASGEQWISTFIPELANAQTPTWLTSAANPRAELPFWLANGIKGRKLAQITAFCAQLAPSVDHWIEWCSGKGHLGRAALFAGDVSAITSIEWQASLCDSGKVLAAQHQCPQTFVHADVLNEDVSAYVTPECGVMALHACGQLHMELLALARRQRASCVLVCPCCYHLIQGDDYQGMSQAALHSGLRLSKLDLKLPLQQMVTTGARGQRLRETELLWRISFSHYAQLVGAKAGYTSVPNFSKGILSQTYQDFCHWASQEKSIPWQPDKCGHSLKLGQTHLKEIAKMELVRQRFRRPLEYWLLLDRALYLEEAGYQVDIMHFCDFAITPRNLLIKAQLRSEQPDCRCD